MSGFAGMVAFDDRVLDLAAMREILAKTAPDGGGEHADAYAALAYAHFDSDPSRPQAMLPATRDGARWIAGDIRLDGRDELAAALGAPLQTPDALLVLQAYERWGEACVEHFTGDFAFAIWDARARALFAARDAFGVKPFYYAVRSDAFVFSSALAAVRTHASAALDDDAVADFLLFAMPLQREATTFRDIRTLPAGALLRVDANGLKTRRWFTLPIEEPLRLTKPEVLEQFRAHLGRAVDDRIGGDRIAISMSGGLDSSSIAAVAAERMRARFAAPRLLAQTIVFDPLVPDDEERFAVAVAAHLGIEHEIVRAAEHRLFERWELPGYAKDEPSSDPFSAITTDQFRRAAQHAPVMLAGQGGDAVFYASHPYFYDLLRRGRWLRFLRDAAGYAITRRRRPPLCLRSSFRRARGIQPPREPFPSWIAPELTRELRLRERWDAYWDERPTVHPTRPQAYDILCGEGWQRLHEYTDPAAMGARIVYRNPYLDLRLVRFLLRLPPMPWFAEKELLREAMRGRLPETVRRRRKTPIGADPAHLWMPRQSGELCERLRRTPELERWVGREAACAAMQEPSRSSYHSYLLCLPLSLAFWLEAQRRHR
ncbi:MAG TPA: asparagine synthase-related protein [Thermoanaerobaculia bacterium]|jgi:asparagine synthase (glutamine-hydrolysing)